MCQDVGNLQSVISPLRACLLIWKKKSCIFLPVLFCLLYSTQEIQPVILDSHLSFAHTLLTLLEKDRVTLLYHILRKTQNLILRADM